jgi:hypothetical protein
MLPWVCAFQGSPPKTWPGLSPGLLSHASQTQRLLAVSTGVPESRSASDPPLLFVMPKHPAWRSSPHRLRAPARSQTFGRRAHRDMGSPCIVPHITAGQPMLLREPSPPYRSRRERLARFLDPTLSKCSHPLPGQELQLEVASRCRISSPATPTGNIVCPGGSSFLWLRTNLISPSVSH